MWKSPTSPAATATAQPAMRTHNIQACMFVQSADFSYIMNQNKPICNTLDTDPTFVNTYGSSRTYLSYFGGRQYGPSYESGNVPIFLYKGTCAQAYEQQNSCPTYDPSIDADDAILSAEYGAVEPNGCVMITTNRPEIEPTLRMSATCLSFYDKNITTGMKTAW